MTVCLYGRGADLDKVNKYLSFSPFDIILISEYVDDMKLPDCECYYIAKSEIKNIKSIILQISRKRHLQYTSVVLCKDILLDSFFKNDYHSKDELLTYLTSIYDVTSKEIEAEVDFTLNESVSVGLLIEKIAN